MESQNSAKKNILSVRVIQLSGVSPIATTISTAFSRTTRRQISAQLQLAMGTFKTAQTVSSRSTTISTASWPKGMYIIKARIGKEEVTEKIVVK